jgi:hypothetical protein
MKICQESPCSFKIVAAMLGTLREDQSVLLVTLNHQSAVCTIRCQAVTVAEEVKSSKLSLYDTLSGCYGS